MANVFRLGKGATKKIGATIEELFDKAKVRLLGPNSVTGKKIFITFDRTLSLPGIFEAGSTEELVRPDLEVLNSLVEVASNYLDAYKERTKARVLHEINGALAEARHLGGIPREDFRTLVNTKLADVWSDVANNVHSIVDTEVAHAKNVSVLDGILGANINANVEDPVVYFVVVRDGDLCDECKRLHLMDDGKTPRLWKLSELGHGYHKKGQDNPKIGGLHPHCRCTIVTLLPGYGFAVDGMIKFVKRGHLELPKQRGLERSEEPVGEPLQKMALLNVQHSGQLPSHPAFPDEKIYNYTHLLPEEIRRKGVFLHVLHNTYPNPNSGVVDHHIEAWLREPRAYGTRRIGTAFAFIRPNEAGEHVMTPHFNEGIIDEVYRGKGLGKAMYNALYGHVYNHLNVRTVKGHDHTFEAGRVHESLAREHGMHYDAPLIEPTERTQEYSKIGVARGPYQYTLKNELEKMAIRDLPQGRPVKNDRIPGGYTHDYSHMLAPIHRKSYKLALLPGDVADGDPRMELIHNGEAVGGVTIVPQGNGTAEIHSYLEPRHRNKGLGTRMYEAAYSHLYNHMFIKQVVGGGHSKDAHRVHQSLARKHGLDYRAGTTFAGQHESYKYNLKSEQLEALEALTKAASN